MWKILLLDTKKHNPNHYLMLGIEYALKKHKDVESVTVAHYGNAINKAIENQCNLFIAFDGEEIEPIICSRLKQICKKSLVWYVEDPYEIKINIENSKYFDLVFTNDKGSLEEYPGKAFHLPLAASEELHYFPISNANRYDLFFAGTAWPNRVETLKMIEECFSDIKLKLALPTNQYLPPINLSLNPSEYNWKTPNNEFARFSNQSKIVLSLHRKFTASDGKEEALTPGPRLFESALAGCLQLIDRNIPGVNDYFVENEDYIAFSSPEECIDKIEYYLKHDAERNKIALSAQEKVKKFHLYENRVDYILSKVKEIPEDKNEIKLSIKKNILIVAHNVCKFSPFGGVEIYIDILKEKINEDFNCFYYVPNKDKGEGEEYLLLDGYYNIIERVSFLSPLPTISEYMLSCEQREHKFAYILSKYNINLVHYQHLIRHIPSLPFISKSLGIPSIFSVHDYFPISHRFNLLDNQGKFDFDNFNSNINSDILLADSEGIQFGSQESRIAFWSQLFKSFNLIHYNSSTTKRYIEEIYPENTLLNNTVRAIPYNGDFSEIAIYNNSISEKEYLDILIIGNFTRVKGADVLLRVFNMTRNSKLRFYVYGRIDGEFAHAINVLNFPHVTFYGEYKNSDLKKVLTGKDISLHLSTWPETFCITLSEVWASNIVPIVTNLGALGERVTPELGYKVKPNNVGEVVDLLLRLSDNREEILLKKENINKYRENIENKKSHFEWIIDVYRKLANTSYYNTKEHKNKIDLFTCNIHFSSIFWAKKDNNLEVIPVGIPKNPLHLMRFILNYTKQNGIKTTIYKTKAKLCNKLNSFRGK
ncbi:glycosyltransferase [Aggregatibacter sp. 2125159857]|uniref:glycosyltransferase family protein n=1 Tax=Aggregatibacter sp. 2125159857 TaxID=2820817 RepID=UPI001ADF934F|nr:glycosyltransferase [Aggregatibacter sp. 2125159857]QTO00970.1 glycosyltransferase [Aggregatibacter sp. 2125159857]